MTRLLFTIPAGYQTGPRPRQGPTGLLDLAIVIPRRPDGRLFSGAHRYTAADDVLAFFLAAAMSRSAVASVAV